MFEETRYSADELMRNRRTVKALGIGGLVGVSGGMLFTDWSMAGALGALVIIVGFTAAMWWLFASRRAGPVDFNPGHHNALMRAWNPNSRYK